MTKVDRISVVLKADTKPAHFTGPKDTLGRYPCGRYWSLGAPTKHMIEETTEVGPPGAEAIPISYSDETLLWKGTPSQWVNLPIFIVWFITFAGSVVFLALWELKFKTQYPPLYQEYIPYIGYSFMALAVIFNVVAYLTVKNELTIITANKIEESTGILSIFRDKKYCEISDITDITSPPPGLLGLFGLASVVILANDDDQPVIRIRAIRNRDQLVGMLMPVWRKLRMDRKSYFEGP